MTIGLLVLAKEPRAGFSKTRLCPPCSPAEAALLAAAAVTDTLAAVNGAAAARKVLVLEGASGDWVPAGFEMIRQRGNGLDERLANAFADFGDAALLIGMDTPQVTPAILDASCGALQDSATDAVLGPTTDGGYWAVGLKTPNADALLGVPMSTTITFSSQLDRMHALNLRCVSLPKLRDVDYFDDACAVAQLIPTSEFAYSFGRVLARIGQRIA